MSGPYRKYFATLNKQNILNDFNYCFDSLAIRLLSKDLKTPYPKNRTTQISWSTKNDLFGWVGRYLFIALPFYMPCVPFANGGILKLKNQ